MKYNIIWLKSVDSTNNEAKRRIDSLSNMSVIAAYEQTAGRGQRGNTWLTAPGMNLTFSIVLKYTEGEFPKLNQIKVNELISLTLIELLSNFGIDARIKLPNDIYVSDKKICGILIEHTLKGERLTHSIIGVGLNVNQCDFDDCLPNPTSMLLETGTEEINLKTVLGQLMNIFLNNVIKL